MLYAWKVARVSGDCGGTSVSFVIPGLIVDPVDIFAVCIEASVQMVIDNFLILLITMPYI